MSMTRILSSVSATGSASRSAGATALIAFVVAWGLTAPGYAPGATVPFPVEHPVTSELSGACSITAVDVDRDGDLDLVGAGFFGSQIIWWENTAGDGTGWTASTIASSFAGAISVFSADMDRDGDLDVLSASQWFDDVTWWENTAGDGTAWTEQLIDGDFPGATGVFAGDIDGDGDLDVLGAADTGGDITWWENSLGDGSAWIERPVDAGFAGAVAVIASDVDGDGDLDIAGAARTDNEITWWENVLGDGTAWTGHPVGVAFGGANALCASDMDEDGDMDLLGSAATDGDVSWWENTAGDGTAWTERSVDALFPGAKAVCSADVDGDGDPDILAASQDSDTLSWWENRTNHRSALFPARVTIDDAFGDAVSIEAADVDGDGDQDVVGADGFDLVAWWRNNAGDGSGWDRVAIDAAFIGASSAVAGDLDGDGDLDVAGAASIGDVSWWENTAGDGSAWTEREIEKGFTGAFAVAVADLDGDSDLDVAGTSFSADEIRWWENASGDGSVWTEHPVADTFDGAVALFIADFDGDGDCDLAGAAYFGDEISWWENATGDGLNWIRQLIASGLERVVSVSGADVDGDGDMDVLGASQRGDSVSWWENALGDGSVWTERQIDPAFAGASSAHGADLDGDGDVDVLGAAFQADRISWWENAAGDGLMWNPHLVDGAMDGAWTASAADLDGDGLVDILVSALNTDEVAWWRNRGGQFALGTSGPGPVERVAGYNVDALTIEAVHRGRAGDNDQELATLELLFEESDGDPLSQAEAEDLFTAIHLYLDDGSGDFLGSADALVLSVADLALAAGRLTLVLGGGDPAARVAHAAPRTYFVVTELTRDADLKTPNQFQVTHLTESTSTALDRINAIPQTLEFVKNASSGIITAVPGVELVITKQMDPPAVFPGDTVTYTITAANLGPMKALAAPVTDIMPEGLSGVTWTCVGQGGGQCLASGVGDINDIVVIPSSGKVIYTATGTVNTRGELANTATVQPQPGVMDADLRNNTATVVNEAAYRFLPLLLKE